MTFIHDDAANLIHGKTASRFCVHAHATMNRDQQRFLDCARNDMCEGWIASHIVFQTAARIHPAPLARPFSKGLLSGEEFRKPNPCFQDSGLREKLGMRNEGSGFAASIDEAMPEGSI